MPLPKQRRGCQAPALREINRVEGEVEKVGTKPTGLPQMGFPLDRGR